MRSRPLPPGIRVPAALATFTRVYLNTGHPAIRQRVANGKWRAMATR